VPETGDDAAVWVGLVEEAYVAARSPEPVPDARVSPELRAKALAAVGAVASRYLCVGTPRTIGLVGPVGATALSLAAHRVWFKPSDVRCHGGVVDGGREVELADALAADVVCIHVPTTIAAGQLRRGTHVNALAEVTIDPDLAVETFHEHPDLAALARGLRDGRQLDEITLLVVGSADTAVRALVERYGSK